jgi:hypothetical protein
METSLPASMSCAPPALARDGRVAAAIALERALRGEAATGDVLDEILRAK